MKVVFFGTPKEVVPVLENLTKHFDVIAVVTAPDQKSGRKQLLTLSPIKTFAQQHNISILQPENLLNINSQLTTRNPQLFIVAAYGKLIPNEILQIPQYGAINIHPSLLPKYRGSTPIQTALLNGDETSGVTIMKMDEQMDHGPILHQIPFTLEKTDTFEWLMRSTFEQAAQILPLVIENYVAEKIKPQPQEDGKATYTKMITKQDGYIDLSKQETLNSVEIDRKIRAYYPWPTVWTKWEMPNGQWKIIKFLPGNKLQVEGKNPVSIEDFFNGYPQMREKFSIILKTTKNK